MKRVIWQIQAALFYLFTLMVALLPSPVADRAGQLAGAALFHLLPKRRAIARDNIEQALPYMKAHNLWNTPADRDAGRITREVFKNIGRSLVEVCRLYHARGEDILKRIEIRGWEHYESAHAKGKGVVFLTGHCGNWELVALAFSHLSGDSMSVVARRQNNPYLNSMVETMRKRYKNSVIYKQGALKGILKALKDGGNIGLLADQAVFPEEGALIEVLGRKAWASKAPVIIAQKSGAAILPSFIHRRDNRFVITIGPAHAFSGDMSEEGIRREVQTLSRYVEEYIIAHPSQWYWVHRRWKRAGEQLS